MPKKARSSPPRQRWSSSTRILNFLRTSHHQVMAKTKQKMETSHWRRTPAELLIRRNQSACASVSRQIFGLRNPQNRVQQTSKCHFPNFLVNFKLEFWWFMSLKNVVKIGTFRICPNKMGVKSEFLLFCPNKMGVKSGI